MMDVNPTELKEMLDMLNQCGVAQATFSDVGCSFNFWPPEYEEAQPKSRDDVKEPPTLPAKIRIVTDEEILLNPYAGLEA